MAVSTTAHAEYRCATPGLLTLGERKACELAHRDSYAPLIHFVHRTQGTYNLYVYDYVSDADTVRWAKHQIPNPPAIAQAKGETRRTSKLD